MLAPNRIGGTIREFLAMQGFSMVESLLDKVDYSTDGAQLMQVSLIPLLRKSISLLLIEAKPLMFCLGRNLFQIT